MEHSLPSYDSTEKFSYIVEGVNEALSSRGAVNKVLHQRARSDCLLSKSERKILYLDQWTIDIYLILESY